MDPNLQEPSGNTRFSGLTGVMPCDGSLQRAEPNASGCWLGLARLYLDPRLGTFAVTVGFLSACRMSLIGGI